MKDFVHPLPLSIFLLNSTIFTFKKIRKGTGDVSSENNSTDYYGGELDFKENGEIAYGGDGIALNNSLTDEDKEIAEGVLASNTKKIEEMSGSIQDINSRLEKFDATMKGVRSDSDGLRQEIVQINDSMKKMLCIYEAITQQYNPFIDDVPTRRSSVPIEDFPKEELTQEEEPLDRIITPDDLVETPSTLADVVGLNGKRCEAAPKKSVAATKAEGRSVSNERMTVRLFEDTVTVSSAGKAQDFGDACRGRMYDIMHLMDERSEMERALDRIFNQRLEGRPAAGADLELFEQWLDRLKE